MVQVKVIENGSDLGIYQFAEVPRGYITTYLGDLGVMRVLKVEYENWPVDYHTNHELELYVSSWNDVSGIDNPSDFTFDNIEGGGPES